MELSIVKLSIKTELIRVDGRPKLWRVRFIECGCTLVKFGLSSGRDTESQL